jgi:hypothetical protein
VGSIVVSVTDNYENRAPAIVRRADYRVGGRGSTTVHVPVRAGRTYEVRVNEGFRDLISSHRVTIGQASRTLLIAAGVKIPQPRADKEHFETGRYLPNVEVANLHANPDGIEFPEFAATYDDATLIVMSGSAFAQMSVAARDIVLQWTRDGGTLTLVNESPGDATAFDALREREHAGSAERLEDDELAARVGQGSLRLMEASALTAFDADLRMGKRYLAAQDHHVDRYRFNGAYEFAHLSEYRSWLGAMSVLLFGFAFAAPIVFLVLRRQRRTERTVVVMPAISLVTFGAIFGVGSVAKPTSRVETMTVHEFVSGQAAGRAVVARGFVRPAGIVRTGPVLADALVNYDDRDYRSHDRGVFHLGDDGALLLNDPAPVDDFVYVSEEGRITARGAITITCNERRQIVVQNELGECLQNSRIYTREGSYDVGELCHAETVSRATHMPVRDGHRPEYDSQLIREGVTLLGSAHDGAVVRVSSRDCEVGR